MSIRTSAKAVLVAKAEASRQPLQRTRQQSTPRHATRTWSIPSAAGSRAQSIGRSVPSVRTHACTQTFPLSTLGPSTSRTPSQHTIIRACACQPAGTAPINQPTWTSTGLRPVLAADGGRTRCGVGGALSVRTVSRYSMIVVTSFILPLNRLSALPPRAAQPNRPPATRTNSTVSTSSSARPAHAERAGGEVNGRYSGHCRASDADGGTHRRCRCCFRGHGTAHVCIEEEVVQAQARTVTDVARLSKASRITVSVVRQIQLEATPDRGVGAHCSVNHSFRRVLHSTAADTRHCEAVHAANLGAPSRRASSVVWDMKATRDRAQQRTRI
jgi:hypothetical protein